MQAFSISFSRALTSLEAARELAEHAEKDLGGADRIAGGVLFATAAAGGQAAEVGRDLGRRWSSADLAGTSFEGLVYGGRVFRDEPAMGLLSWPAGDGEPISVAFEPGEQDSERIVDGILGASGRDSLGPGDLVLLFPDAHGLPSIEPMLPEIEAALGCPAMAGAGASGIDGSPAQIWIGHETWEKGGLLALILLGSPAPAPARAIVSAAAGSRVASPWLKVTASRRRWIDRLDDEPALAVIRRQLGLQRGQGLETYLDRLLIRLRRAGPRGDDLDPNRFDEERYIVGVDASRAGFSLPLDVERGDEIALAWPDAEVAREALRDSLKGIAASPWILQFACRARDAELHGDADVESAWVARHAGSRNVLGTIAPFQLGPGAGQHSRVLVHSSVLAALVSD